MVFSTPPATGVSEGTHELYHELAGLLEMNNLEIVQERIWGCLENRESILAARQEVLSRWGIRFDGPFSFLEGCPLSGQGLAGIIVHAIHRDALEGEIWTFHEGKTVRGKGWTVAGSTYLILQGIQGASRPDSRSNTEQAREMINRADTLLKANGASYRNVIRTWFSLSEILQWYDSFNRVRNELYEEHGFLVPTCGRRKSFPASTGIGVRLPMGCAGSLDLLAAVPAPDSATRIRYLSNPHQQDPYLYESAFSRGVVIEEGQYAWIEVSGTAAVDEQGRTLYVGDARRQIIRTLDDISALLAQEGAHLEDISAATAFLKHPNDAEVLRTVLHEKGLDGIPMVCMVADICRDEFLFEMDAELIVRSNQNPFPVQTLG